MNAYAIHSILVPWLITILLAGWRGISNWYVLNQDEGIWDRLSAAAVILVFSWAAWGLVG